jgi:hypothetical protein
VVAKVLANNMNHVLDKCIPEYQSAFVGFLTEMPHFETEMPKLPHIEKNFPKCHTLVADFCRNFFSIHSRHMVWRLSNEF